MGLTASSELSPIRAEHPPVKKQKTISSQSWLSVPYAPIAAKSASLSRISSRLVACARRMFSIVIGSLTLFTKDRLILKLFALSVNVYCLALKLKKGLADGEARFRVWLPVYSNPTKSTFAALSVTSMVREAKRYCREATAIV